MTRIQILHVDHFILAPSRYIIKLQQIINVKFKKTKHVYNFNVEFYFERAKNTIYILK